MTDLTHRGQAARAASRQLAVLSTAKKNAALLAIADALETQAATVLAANAQDIAAGRAKGLSEALLDRLLLNEKRLAVLADDTPAVSPRCPIRSAWNMMAACCPTACGCASGASPSASSA